VTVARRIVRCPPARDVKELVIRRISGCPARIFSDEKGVARLRVNAMSETPYHFATKWYGVLFLNK
jgi:hypothetical protein